MKLPKNRRPTSPGEMLVDEFLNEWKMTQAEFAQAMGMKPSNFSALIKGNINGTRRFTTDVCLAVADLTGMPVEFWMNCQAACDLWDAQQKHKPLKRLSVAQSA